jgi:hypothetical protein
LDGAGWGDEASDDTPVLASDELQPGAEHLQPAVSPIFERRGSGYFGNDQDVSGRKSRSQTPSAHSSRPNSRPVSIHAGIPSLLRFNLRGEEREEMYTPLEDVEEYEPLFPDDGGKKTETQSTTDRFKQRPEHLKHRFPSQDIWEDAPNSLHLQATVSTPEVSSQSTGVEGAGAEASGPDFGRRKSAISAKSPSTSQESPSHLDSEKRSRADAKQRFPSQDIWEDAPDSHKLVTTVQISDREDKADTPETAASPTILTSSAANKADDEPKGTPEIPVIPARPSRRSHQASPMSEPAAGQNIVSSASAEAKKPPSIPDRPKPQVPLRPAKPVTRTSDDSQTKTISSGSVDSPSPPLVKAKPTIPTRPVGSKIAAFKAGFLSDLDNRLKLGPPGPKTQEKKEEIEAPAEKSPLSDARKGRARGPARRKPAVSPIPDRRTESETSRMPEIRIVDPWNVWQVGGDGILVISQDSMAKKPSESETIPSAEPSVTQAPAANVTSEPSEQPTPRTLRVGNPLKPVASTEESVASSAAIIAEPTPSTSSAEGQVQGGPETQQFMRSPAEAEVPALPSASEVATSPNSKDKGST